MVLEIDIPGRCVVIFDELKFPLLQLIDHVNFSLKRTRLIGMNATYETTPNSEYTEDTKCQKPVKMTEGHILTFDIALQWGLEHG